MLREVSLFLPLLWLVLIDQHLRVVAEEESAVILDPATEPAERIAAVHGFSLLRLPDLSQVLAIGSVVQIAAHEKLRCRGDDGNCGAGVVRGISRGVEKHESIEV